MSDTLLTFSGCKLGYLQLSVIKEVDPEFQNYLDELNLNLPAGINVLDWPVTVLTAFLHSHPICVRKLAGGYRCIAGFRQFKLAQAMPDHEKMVIPVIIFPSRLSAEKKMSLWAAELFIPPALFRLRNGDARILADAWKLLKKLKGSPDLLEFGPAMQIDNRSCLPGKRKKALKKDT